jgi:hypothetical protein
MRKSKFTDSQIMEAVKRVEAGFPVSQSLFDFGVALACVLVSCLRSQFSPMRSISQIS